ncbi:MAG: nicotinate-nucleotide--dimethylbenzimidazole phosphoribosyltransferase, partial [Lachnospiraceae bacterium]|nr:nicotinate-nucleotide--dimethylbenzimidazole phosphoribosyltransferase [Lachnospiraceae bacterium]
VAKPLNSLGKLEALTAKIGAASECSDINIDQRRVLVFCADNGVVEEGVSQSDHTVTTAVAKALAEGSSNVNIFAKMAKADVEVYDVGMVDDIQVPGLVVDKRKNGTANFVKGPAMSREDALKAIETGIKAVEKAKADGINVVVIGEMGIGNTTTSAAIISILLGLEPEEITGRGSGLSDDGLKRKINVIKKCREVNQPNPADPIDVLAKAGGFDIAAMCGVILGGAAIHLPIILDGLISGTAALLAYKIDERTVDYMIPSHVSKEPGGNVILNALNLSGPISADMALGEGTGGVALLPLLDMALALYKGTHSFDNIGIEAYVEQK